MLWAGRMAVKERPDVRAGCRPFHQPREVIVLGWPAPLKAGLRPPPPAACGRDGAGHPTVLLSTRLTVRSAEEDGKSCANFWRSVIHARIYVVTDSFHNHHRYAAGLARSIG